jgi:hypothetical protein
MLVASRARRDCTVSLVPTLIRTWSLSLYWAAGAHSGSDLDMRQLTGLTRNGGGCWGLGMMILEPWIVHVGC